MLWAELLVLPVLERLDSGCGEKTAWRAALDPIDLVRLITSPLVRTNGTTIYVKRRPGRPTTKGSSEVVGFEGKERMG
jgi:hypothetical protein